MKTLEEVMNTPPSREEQELMERIWLNREDLTLILDDVSGDWAGDDLFYRIYHQSFKGYALQNHTLAIVEVLKSMWPGRELNPMFMAVVERGTGRSFQVEHNQRWAEETLPILEAFLHAREFLRFFVKYAKPAVPAGPMSSGWGAILTLPSSLHPGRSDPATPLRSFRRTPPSPCAARTERL